MIEEERGSTTKLIFSVIVFAVFVVASIFIIFFVFNNMNNKNSEHSSSIIESSSSSVLPIESSSEKDPYIDDVITNIKKYVVTVNNDIISSPMNIDKLYAVNTYVESETTHLIYGFTIKEDDNGYINFDIDLEEELTDEQVIAKIHDDTISIDMFVGHELYKIDTIDITSKESFKDKYKGTYKMITYSDDSEQYYMSGLGINDDKYILLNNIAFDKSTYEIDDIDGYINIVNNGRYFELLEALYMI